MPFSFRGCRSQVFLKIGVLKISKEKTCVGVSFNKAASLKACNFIKKRMQHRCSPVKFCKIFKNIFFYRTHLVGASVSFNEILLSITISRSSHRRYSVKKLFLKTSQISLENTYVGFFF